MKTGSLIIKTPEGIVFSQMLAGPCARFLAWSVDLLVIIVLGIALGTAAGLLRVLGSDVATAAARLGYFVISIGYGILLEWLWRGQTIGKRLFRLRVVDVECLRLQLDQIVTRNLLRVVDMLPGLYMVGGIACWLSRRGQRLGDLAANTIVIRTPLLVEPDLDQLISGKFNSLRQYPHIAARLRQRVSPAEAATALQALLRRDQFDLTARVDLFEQLAQHFRAKADFPPEATEGITDEQYIRNVVDVIYQVTRISS